MPRHNRFLLANDLPHPMHLNIEPEGSVVSLPRGEEVIVTESFTSQPLTLKFAHSAKGELIVSIWPGDGDVSVEKNGEDVLHRKEKVVVR